MRSVRVCLLIVVAAFGCGESVRNEGDSVECTTDLDCADGQTCVFSEGAPRDLEALGGGAGVGIPNGGVGGTCPSTSSCGAGCPPGGVCTSGSMPGCPSHLNCVADCANPDAVPCELGTVCRASRACEPIRCDDPEYTGCPTGMTCDPMADPFAAIPGRYTLFGTDQYPHTDNDRGPILTERQLQAVAASCVFLRCDESGGFDCLEGFVCDVENAPATNVGCVAIPCGELGRCSGDAFICEPTSSETRPTIVDAHGCVTKNCEEGAPCPVSTECDFTRPGTPLGCAYIRCDEPGGSCPLQDTKCDPEPAPLPSGRALTPDAYGCVPKHCDLDGFPCPGVMVCDPSNPSGTTTGCAPPPEPPDPSGGTGGTPSGGTGGTSGTSGTSAGTSPAGSSGSAGQGGTTSDPSTPGVCR